MSPEEIQNFKDWQLPLPTRDPHGVDSSDSPVSSQLVKLHPRNWRLEGNKLIADTDFGPLVNIIAPDLIMTGIDSDDLPILKKIQC